MVLLVLLIFFEQVLTKLPKLSLGLVILLPQPAG